MYDFDKVINRRETDSFEEKRKRYEYLKAKLIESLKSMKKAVPYIHGEGGSASYEGNDLNELLILLEKESE